MPVKKGGKKKKPAAKPKKEAFKQMPSLVINNIRMTPAQPEQSEPTPTIEKPPVEAIGLREKFLRDQSMREKKVSIWIWVSIVVVMVLIITFWSYSIWYGVSTINWKKTDEGKLIKQTTIDWDEAFKKRQQEEINKEAAATRIKAVLGTVLQQATSVTSTTPTTTSSTINIPTSTKR